MKIKKIDLSEANDMSGINLVCLEVFSSERPFIETIQVFDLDGGYD